MGDYFKIFFLLKKFQPYSVYFLLFLFVNTAVLEAFGISLVIPIIALVLDANFINTLRESGYAIYLPNFILEMNYDNALLFFSIFLVISYFLKNLILLIAEYYKNLFLGNVKSNLSVQLMNNYLHQDYLYHSKKNSFEFNSIINQKLNDLSDGLFSSVLIIFSEIIMIFFIIFLIIFANQEKTFLIILILFFLGALLGKIVNKIVKKLGSNRNEHLKSKFKNFNIIINSFREFLVVGKTGGYFQNFKNSILTIAKLDSKRSAFQKSPQLILELIGIITLILIIYYLKYLNFSSVKIVAICGFFAAISYRAIPSLNKIFYFHYNIKYYKPILTDVLEELEIDKKIEYHNDKFEKINLIQLNDVSFKYHDKKDPILQNLDFKIELNSSVGIFGESGIGKTTFLDILAGLIKVNNGFLSVNGVKIDNSYLIRKYQNNISYTSQKTIILNDTFEKNICFYENNQSIKKEKFEKAITFANLNDLNEYYKNNNQFIIDNQGKNLSGGQIQRIGIARALYQDKDVLVFDEATNSLDEELEKKIVSNLIRIKQNKVIIFVSHNLNILENLDHIYEVKNKNIYKIK